MLRRLFIGLLILSALTSDGTIAYIDCVYNLNLYSEFGLDLLNTNKGQIVRRETLSAHWHDLDRERMLFCSDSCKQSSFDFYDKRYINLCLNDLTIESNYLGTGLYSVKDDIAFFVSEYCDGYNICDFQYIPYRVNKVSDVKNIVLQQSDSSPPVEGMKYSVV